jgi:hypothetical protein
MDVTASCAKRLTTTIDEEKANQPPTFLSSRQSSPLRDNTATVDPDVPMCDLRRLLLYN